MSFCKKPHTQFWTNLFHKLFRTFPRQVAYQSDKCFKNFGILKLILVYREYIALGCCQCYNSFNTYEYSKVTYDCFTQFCICGQNCKIKYYTILRNYKIKVICYIKATVEDTAN